jgi:hypothetical protein
VITTASTALSQPPEDSMLTKGALLAGTLLLAVFLVLTWGALRDTAFGENAPAVTGSVVESASLQHLAPSPSAGVAVPHVVADAAPASAPVTVASAKPSAQRWAAAAPGQVPTRGVRAVGFRRSSHQPELYTSSLC